MAPSPGAALPRASVASVQATPAADVANATLQGQASTSTPPLATKDPGWPREFTKNGTTLSIHQPQVDSWKDHAQIRFKCAVEVNLAGGSGPQWGVLAVQGDTFVDEAKSDVEITNMKVGAMNFPGASAADSAALRTVVLDMLPNLTVMHVALQRVMACLHGQQEKPAGVALNLQPPPIYYSAVPAVLVIFMGPPQFETIAGTNLMWAVNTNWVVIQDAASQGYFLLVGKSWLTSQDVLNGPWTAVTQLPADFLKLPKDAQWADVAKNVPGQPNLNPPTVLASTQPAELILTNGLPEYTPIAGTGLMYVSNPPMPVFWDGRTSLFYYLVAGRWFSAASLDGPWAAASATLPPEFAKIPEGNPMGFVLASVPGTPEADDAVLLAQVPHKSEVKLPGPPLAVAYQGAPKFEPITGTTMQYATNTAYQVVETGGKYYCCSQGIWFVAPAATGPWAIATTVPAVIYTIPPTSPIYNCTYVRVYDATPTTVVYGYTSGYSGAYVATTGALMFGAGVALGAVLANNSCCWYGYPPCCYSYGCAPYYHYGYCGYYSAGYAHYGPYGGAGWAAGYNPATGNYYRGGAVSGPDGARWGGQAYNPWTGTYAQHTGGTNGYKSWGSSYVSNGNYSAQAGHESTARGSAGYAANSDGQWAEGAHSNATNSSVARTSSGVYAGHDGNVYKNTGSGWEKYGGGGSWNSVQRPDTASTGAWQQQGAADQAAHSGWQNSGDASSLQNHWNSQGSQASHSWSSGATQNGLNHDSWSRGYGNGGGGGWGGQSHSFGGGGGGWGGGSSWGGSHGWGGGSFGGGGGFRGGGFRR